MPFRVAQKTLERLEWPQVVARLQAHCRTPQARQKLVCPELQEGDDRAESAAPAVFAQELAQVRARLAETSEARSLLNAEQTPPLDSFEDLAVAFRRAAKGGALTPQQLLDVRGALRSLHATVRFLASRQDECPRLAALCAEIEEQRGLERHIDDCIDPSGDVLDRASPTLREARTETKHRAAQIQARLERVLQNPDVASALSDNYYTLRNERYVLPVRADKRGRVPGIVHDASNSGTTLFVEPEGVVELNNQLKQAELAAAREIERILRELTLQLAEALPSLGRGFDALARIDLAFARGQLSLEMDAVEPEVAREGCFELLQLRHPLLPVADAIPNDLRLGRDFRVMVISGPNGGGKTVTMKAAALAALFVRAGLHVPCAAGARVDFVDTILADIGDDQDIRQSLSTFSAHMANVAEIVESASEHALVVLDEVGVGTDPSEGAALAQAVLERLAERGARVIATTHYNLLKEMAAVDPRFCNASVEFDPETLAPTYRLHLGEPGISSATAVAARMGMQGPVLERANALLEREDRRLDRMLSELAASRAALDAEQREASRLRAEGEVARDEYRARLERLQERRDKLYHSMREDLDQAFKGAHARVAGVIRDLQRGGTAQAAGRARSRLLDIEEKTRDAARAAGIDSPLAADEKHPKAVDWRHISPGDPVSVPGGRRGILESLPDRRGKVRVQVGAAVLVVDCDRVRSVTEGSPTPCVEARPAPLERADRDELGGGTMRCDLRGQRVDEALECVSEALDRATRESRDGVLFVHGFGTGALRKAIREHLGTSPYVDEFRPGDADQGGDGVTVAALRR